MAYGALAGVLLPVTMVALIGAGMWGYQEHNEKNSILIKAENSYQRAFHDLNFHIDRLHDELGKSIVVNSRRQVTPSLTNVWRLSYAAKNDVDQLPLTLMPFNNTEAFLSKVSTFSYDVAVRDLNQSPLTDKEYKTLRTLYTNSKEIKKQLHDVQSKVIDKSLRWMDVETALASDDKKSDNTIIDGFRKVDKKVEEFPEIDWGTSIQTLDKKQKMRIKGVDGKPTTPAEAKQIAIKFIGINPSNAHVEVNENGKPDQYSAYSVRITSNELKSPINMDVTKKGGHVVWLLNEREIGKRRMNLDQAEKSGVKFLKAHGYDNMVAVERDIYGGLGVFTFVPETNGVRIYPDAVTAKVALDTGDVNGFHATEYLFNHKKREIPQPKINQKKARQAVNPNVKVSDEGLAIIEGKKDGKEVLCYEFTGDFEGVIYRIYVNAANGEEEEVVKMDSAAEA